MTYLNRRSLLWGAAALGAGAAMGRAYAQAPSGPFKLDPLPYAANKNEPHIDAQTMEIHHGRHHAAYVNNLNGIAQQHGQIGQTPLHEILAKLSDVPEAVRTAVRNNGGGHANHTMFWQIMGGSGGEPKGEVKAAIDRDLGGFAKFQEDFNAAGGRVFGSGWVFVTVDRRGQARPRHQAEPGHAVDGRPACPPRQRRLGTRLLPQIPEPPPRLPQGVVERRELGQDRRALCGRQGGQADDLSPSSSSSGRAQCGPEDLRTILARWRGRAG